MMRKRRLNKVRRLISRCRFIGISLLIVLSSVSCGDSGSSEDGFPLGSQLVPLTIEASLTGELAKTTTQPTNAHTTRATPATRAVIDTEGAQIGVFLTTQKGYKPMYDKKYTCTAEGWKAAAEPVCVSSNPARVPAYYDPNSLNPFPIPANSFVTNANALAAQLYAESKLWYYDDTQTNVTNANPAIAFKMKPAYARVILSIQRHATNYGSGACAITNVALSTNGAFAKTATLDISNGTTTGSTTGAYSQVLNPAITIAAGKTNATCDLLLPPQPIANQGLTIALTVDKVVRTVTAAPSYFDGSELVPGVRYTIYLLITDAEITISGGVTMQDFGDNPTNGDVDAPI